MQKRWQVIRMARLDSTLTAKLAAHANTKPVIPRIVISVLIESCYSMPYFCNRAKISEENAVMKPIPVIWFAIAKPMHTQVALR